MSDKDHRIFRRTAGNNRLINVRGKVMRGGTRL